MDRVVDYGMRLGSDAIKIPSLMMYPLYVTALYGSGHNDEFGRRRPDDEKRETRWEFSHADNARWIW